jgi:hypothetical protein
MHAIERFSAGAAIAALSAGCAPDVSRGEPVAEVASAATVQNGEHFNGEHFNGEHFNGARLDPVPLQVHLGGHALTGVTLVGSVLSGTQPSGVVASGAALTGAELRGTLESGEIVKMRIDAVTTAPAAPDVSLYAVTARVGDGAPGPLCGVGAGGAPVLAIPLQGSWDASAGTPTGGAHVADAGTFTFACRGYALAKCVEFGYAPWRSVTECRAPGDCHQLSLEPFHQACTRMLRADYCGDGTPTTRDGTLVDVWDELGVQSDDAATWALEGEWGEGGATCVLDTRWATVTPAGESVQQYIQDHCPSRWRPQGCGAAGSPFFTSSGFSMPLATRPLLRTRITPATPSPAGG